MDKKEKMFSLVDRWRKSGLTRKTFADQHGLTDSSFEYWCRKRDNKMVKGSVSHPGFVELTPAVGEKPTTPRIELLLSNGLLVKIY
jgi:hypothetical protein